MPLSILLIGDSHVRRTSEYSQRTSKSKTFSISQTCDVRFHGVGGRTIATILQRDLAFIAAMHPDILFIHVGGNDLASLQPQFVSTQLALFCKTVLNYCKHIIISQRNFRYVSSPNYNHKVLLFNAYAYALSTQYSNIHFWSHDFRLQHKHFLYDGVHFNEFGNKRFYYSIKRCLKMAAGEKWWD